MAYPDCRGRRSNYRDNIASIQEYLGRQYKTGDGLAVKAGASKPNYLRVRFVPESHIMEGVVL